MLKLMKYEFLRRKTLLIVVLSVLFAMEALTAFGIYKGVGWLGLSITLISIMCIGVPIFVFFDSISTYYSDLKNKHGYMLFLTPNNGFKIIGSKLIIGVIEAIIFTSLVVFFMYINFEITHAMYLSEVNDFTIGFSQVISELKEQFPYSFWQVALVSIISFLLSWFSTILMAILSITISKTILSNNRHNWVVSIGVFIGISFLLQVISMLVMTPFGFYNDIFTFGVQSNFEAYNPMLASQINNLLWKSLLVGTGLNLIYMAAFYFVSGTLLNKRIDL